MVENKSKEEYFVTRDVYVNEIQISVFLHEVSLGHINTHSFTCCLWLLSPCRSEVAHNFYRKFTNFCSKVFFVSFWYGAPPAFLVSIRIVDLIPSFYFQPVPLCFWCVFWKQLLVAFFLAWSYLLLPGKFTPLTFSLLRIFFESFLQSCCVCVF